jgi:hypothetical protein
MFYGSAIGDSLGILTEFMKPCEAEFYYDKGRMVRYRYQMWSLFCEA